MNTVKPYIVQELWDTTHCCPLNLNLIVSNLFVGIHLVSAAAAAVPKDRCMPTNPFWLSFAVTYYMKRPALHLHDRKDVTW